MTDIVLAGLPMVVIGITLASVIVILSKKNKKRDNTENKNTFESTDKNESIEEDNMATGMSLGMCFGVAIGSSFMNKFGPVALTYGIIFGMLGGMIIGMNIKKK